MDFHKDYLTNTHLHKEYQTKTITEQELILKNVRNNKGEHFIVGNRQYKGHFEIWKGQTIMNPVDWMRHTDAVGLKEEFKKFGKRTRTKESSVDFE